MDLHENMKRLRYGYSFMRKKLIHLNLQLLYTCNFKCKICDFWHEPYNKYPQLSLDNIRTIAEKLKPISPLVISIGGGEPLIHKDIVEITKVLAKDNFPVMICNGWYVTPEIAKDLFSAGMYEISISVDFADAEKHDGQRGKQGAFDRALYALKTLHENRTEPHQRVHMISVIMDDNIDDIEKLILMSKDMGITFLNTFYSNCRGSKENRASFTNIRNKLLVLKNKYPEYVTLPGYIERLAEIDGEKKGIFPCYAGKNLFNIDSQGNVTRCIDRLEEQAGNILTDDISVLKKKLLEFHKNNDCGECWTSCRGSIETLMYGNGRLDNYKSYYHITKSVPIKKSSKVTA